MVVDPIAALEAPHQAWINDDAQDRSATEGAREQEAACADAVERAAQAEQTARPADAETCAAKAEQQALTSTSELASRTWRPFRQAKRA
jgi:hypothetical protein